VTSWEKLFKAVPRAETAGHLLTAAAALVSRWSVLVEAVSAEPDFICPSYEAPPKPEASLEWNEALDQRGLIDRLIADSGRKREDISESEMELLRQIEANNMSNIKNPLQFAQGI
jgi:hypothetical protein